MNKIDGLEKALIKCNELFEEKNIKEYNKLAKQINEYIGFKGLIILQEK